tara:strand:- start:4079 stop:4759 length:681 start_codon:yes stop_codon:yes gene_type:complete
MNIKVVTTYNNKLYDIYAHRFFSTYNWPFEIVKYNEDENLFNLVPECKNFVNRNSKKEVKGFKWDGVRFCYKVYAFTHAILNEQVDGLICMDADSVFHNSIDIEFVKEHLHKPDTMMAYLGRVGVYSECGFLYFNLQHPETKNYAKSIKEMYDNDLIYNLREWHDSFIWDHVRIKYEKEKGVKNVNLTPNHVIHQHAQAVSILGKYYDHCKGQRKIKGKSPENRQL